MMLRFMSRVVFTIASLVPLVAGDACPQEVTLGSYAPSQITSSDGQEVTIALSISDLNKIKALEGLAVNESTSFLSVAPEMVEDAAGQKIAQINHKEV
jgi:hypothetical protein